jgi:transposase
VLRAQAGSQRSEGEHFVLSYKRLEAGTFKLVRRPDGEATHVEINSAELALMLEGIELQDAKRRKRFRPDDKA